MTESDGRKGMPFSTWLSTLLRTINGVATSRVRLWRRWENLSDVDIDRVALEVADRLSRVPNEVAVHDPQQQLFELADTVLRELPADRLTREHTPAGAQENPGEHAQRLLDSLPETQRDLVVLYRDGMTASEIAQRESMPKAAVMQLLTKAFTHMRLQDMP